MKTHVKAGIGVPVDPRPRDIAERIGLPIKEIYKAKRRLKARLGELRAEGSGD